MKNKYIKTLLLFATLALLFGCSTKKNTFSRRAYHKTTAYFNAYYNGNLAYREGMKVIDKESKDNHNLIIPIFPYSNPNATSKARSNMDRAFMKASKVIQKHSITVKPKSKPKNDRQRKFYDQPEFVKWVWHSYLLTGKSHFMRNDFYAAVESFSYVIKTYSAFPIKHEARLWLARTYNEMENYKKAESILRLMEGDTEFPVKLTKTYSLIYADYYLKQRQYELAIKWLEEGVTLTKNKVEKNRYQYILAKIYQEIGDDKNAIAKYNIVISQNRNYDITFNSIINMAQISSKSESDNTNLKKALSKMTREAKNEEYLDQLYHALGKIAENENKLEEAKELYLKSAHSSVKNDYQKGESYLDLGKIYLNEPDYKKAQIYLDSAIGLVSKDIIDYDTYYRLTQNLGELVTNITVVETQDSLQRMARMDEGERNALIDKTIAEIIEKEREEQLKEQMDRLAAAQMQQSSTALENNTQSGGTWYFYNQSLLAAGAVTFQTKWGSREVGDDWRRSDKTASNFDIFSNDTIQQQQQSEGRISDNKKREYYLQDLPLTDSAIQVSDSMIHIALYKTATIFKDKIEDLPASNEYYEQLLKRFPQTSYELESWYYMYKNYTALEDNANATIYRNKIIEKYPLSKYAQSMTNPEFFKQEAAKEQESKFMYATTYKLFETGQYDKVIANSQYADTMFLGNTYQSKFALLKAISIGRTTDSATFVQAIDEYIKNYSFAEEIALAKDIKSYLTGEQKLPEGAQKKEEETIAADSAAKQETEVQYTYDPQAPHMYVTIVNSANSNANRIKFNLSNLNIDYYPMFEFTVASEIFSVEKELIKISPFKDSHTAMNYYYSIIFLDEVYADITNLEYEQFVISTDNYKKLSDTKAINTYLNFFKTNYPKQ